MDEFWIFDYQISTSIYTYMRKLLKRILHPHALVITLRIYIYIVHIYFCILQFFNIFMRGTYNRKAGKRGFQFNWCFSFWFIILLIQRQKRIVCVNYFGLFWYLLGFFSYLCITLHILFLNSYIFLLFLFYFQGCPERCRKSGDRH